MGLTSCPDCGKSISTEAPACPNCGRPLKAATTWNPVPSGSTCPHCGETNSVAKVRGLQGLGEVLLMLVLVCLFVIPGIVYYAYIESVPYCSACGRRV